MVTQGDGMFRGGSHRTGVSGEAGPPPGFSPWGRRMSGPVRAAPVVTDGLVVAGDAGGRLVALDALDGSHRWNLRTDAGPLLSPPIAYAGLILIRAGGSGGTLLAVDAASGEVRWRFATGAGFSAPPAAADGLVAVVAHRGLTILRAADGEVVAERELGGPSQFTALGVLQEVIGSAGRPDFYGCPPAIADGRVHLVVPNQSLRAFALADARPLWQAPLNLAMHAGCAVAGGIVHVADLAGEAHALRADDGEPVWTEQISLLVDRAMPVVDGGIVYFAGRAPSTHPPLLTSGAIVALDAATGELRWRKPTAAWVEASPAAGHGRLIYATRGTAENAAELAAVDASDGRHLWSRPVEHRGPGMDTSHDGLRASPVVHDGILYFGMPSGSLQTLDAATGTDAGTFRARDRIRRGVPAGPFPGPAAAHLNTVLTGAATAFGGGLLGALATGRPAGMLAGLAVSPLVMLAADRLAALFFRIGLKYFTAGRGGASAFWSGLARLTMYLVPPTRKRGARRVRAVANVAAGLGAAGYRSAWPVAAGMHLRQANALAERFPGPDTTLLRAHATGLAARGYAEFGERDVAARHAAHAVDLYLSIDAFGDPANLEQARQIDALYRSLTGN
ncbi:PQQ-binding-like beta-propeller repeat protein [Actinoplanes sp. NPDC026670]|uniref:outer membrane protein assembly factor BamB family protein n=1 Tax=Actinoplanes sp. NPDC026670 TaxID=3154700 RepID=UPI0033C46084